jgi:PhzF family phenazine biosynthesis protein
MLIDVQIVNAFVDGAQGGNPAAVVLNADHLNAAQKLSVAQKIGLSETAFVSRSELASVKLEFFTPNRQIAHCGHATIATFSLMRQLGLLSEGELSKETIDGTRSILIRGEMAYMEQRAPKYQEVALDSERCGRILNALGLRSDQLLSGFAPTVVNTGNSFLLVALKDEATVAEIQARQSLIHALSDELDLIGFYVFSKQSKQAQRHAGSRMFAPRFGIDEESATGMAAGPLACYLHDYMQLNDTHIFIEQGYLMPVPSPSVIHVVLDVVEGRINGLMAGGRARRSSQMDIEID